jgi:hypothetical protein
MQQMPEFKDIKKIGKERNDTEKTGLTASGNGQAWACAVLQRYGHHHFINPRNVGEMSLEEAGGYAVLRTREDLEFTIRVLQETVERLRGISRIA